MRAKGEMEEECEPCREMQQTEEGDTNWGVCSVSLKGIFITLFSWIEKTFTDVRSVCAGVKSVLLAFGKQSLSLGTGTTVERMWKIS